MLFTKKSEPPAPMAALEPISAEQEAADLSARLAATDSQLRILEVKRGELYVRWLNVVNRIADARTANAALAAQTKSEVNDHGFRNEI